MRREPPHRDVRAHRVAAAGAEEIVVGRLVGRRVPGGDGPVLERQLRVRDDLLEVHADHAPEALAGGARPERRVEGEERRASGPGTRAPQPGQWSPRWNVRARRPRRRPRREPASANADLDRGGDLGARLLPHHEPPDDERADAPPRPGGPRPSPPISTVSPAGHERPEEAGALQLRETQRAPPRRGAARRAAVPRRSAPRAPARRASAVRPLRRAHELLDGAVDPPGNGGDAAVGTERRARRARRAAAASRGSPSASRPSSGRCARRSSARARSPAAPARSSPRRAGRASPGTAARRSRATPRSGAGPRHRACRRRARTCPSPRRP